MLKIFRKLFTWIWRAAILFGISGQANKPDLLYDPSLPPKLSQRLDSLRGADDLAEWLYTYRDYVNEDPENRIALLAKAQLTTWRTCRTDNERTSYFYCLASQGYNLLFIGNILHSIDAYEQAYRFYINKPIPLKQGKPFAMEELVFAKAPDGSFKDGVFKFAIAEAK